MTNEEMNCLLCDVMRAVQDVEHMVGPVRWKNNLKRRLRDAIRETATEPDPFHALEQTMDDVTKPVAP